MVEGVNFKGLQIPSLLFADMVVLLASTNSDLQLTLGGFAAKCDVVGMRISTSKSELMVLSGNGWIDHSRLGESRFSKRRSLSISGSS